MDFALKDTGKLEWGCAWWPRFCWDYSNYFLFKNSIPFLNLLIHIIISDKQLKTNSPYLISQNTKNDSNSIPRWLSTSKTHNFHRTVVVLLANTLARALPQAVPEEVPHAAPYALTQVILPPLDDKTKSPVITFADYAKDSWDDWDYMKKDNLEQDLMPRISIIRLLDVLIEYNDGLL